MSRTADLDVFSAWKNKLWAWRANIPDFDAMSDQEFEHWRQDFRLKLDAELAWLNYKRSDEWKALERSYNKWAGWWPFFTAYVVISLALWFAGADFAGVYEPLISLGGAFAVSIAVTFYARKRYSPHSWEYILENYWPTDDGDPKTDVSALPTQPETISDRLFQGLWVILWLAFILYVIFEVISRQGR